MAKRVKNKTRRRRTYRKKTNRVSNRKKINKKKTVKRKNIMIGGSLKGKKLNGDLDIDLSKIMAILKSFGVLGTDSISSILTDTAEIRARIISATGYIKGKVMGQNGGGFGLNFILKKIAKVAAFGLLLESLNYFLVQPNLERIFKYINSKAFLTFDGSNLGICFVNDGEEYKVHLKNSSTFPLWINIKDYIDALLPIIIKAVYSNSIVKQVFAAKSEPIKSEEELLHHVEMELIKRQNGSNENQGGGGGQMGGFSIPESARKLYERTKGRLSGAKQMVSKKMNKMGDKMKDTIFSNSLIGAACAFFILHFIYIVYEKAIDSSGRWLKLKYKKDTLYVNVSKNLNEDGVPIPITTKFVAGSIKGKIEELQKESNKQEEELQQESNKQEGDVEDVGEETSELLPTSSQPDSPPTEPTPSSPESAPTTGQRDVSPNSLEAASKITDQAKQREAVMKLNQEAIFNNCMERRKCNSPRTLRKGKCKSECEEASLREVHPPPFK